MMFIVSKVKSVSEWLAAWCQMCKLHGWRYCKRARLYSCSPLVREIVDWKYCSFGVKEQHLTHICWAFFSYIMARAIFFIRWWCLFYCLIGVDCAEWYYSPPTTLVCVAQKKNNFKVFGLTRHENELTIYLTYHSNHYTNVFWVW